MRFGDIHFHSASAPGLILIMNQPVRNPEIHLHFIAVSSIYAARKSRELTSVFNEGLSIVDSKPLSTALGFLGFKCSNLRGTDFLRIAIASESGINQHFFIGSTPETLEQIKLKANLINPKFQIVGAISPSYKDNFEEDYATWISEVKRTGANVIWIGLGSPKQDFLASDLTNRFGIRTVAVGAAFDFFSETVKEAPEIMRKLFLEWLYRLVTDPRRLWRRYLLGNFYFLFTFSKLLMQYRLKKASKDLGKLWRI
ncbi:WecG Teichoic acid biosynthesis proteins [Candidatus Nanopelagicaceae bacterium]